MDKNVLANNITFRHLRLTPTACLKEYLANTRLWGEVGNEAFAEHVRSAHEGNAPSTDSSDKPYRLYHSWLPQMMELTESQAASIHGLIRGTTEQEMTQEQAHWAKALQDFGWLNDEPADIELLTQRALKEIIAIQNPYELREYLKLVQQLKPKVVVEIGTARGGMLYCFSQLASPDALIISIDLPGAPNCGGQTEIERKYYSSFIQPGQQIKFIPANSHFHATREMLRRLLAGRKADILFIDGDHSYGGVKVDFDMYAEFASPDGLLTLHDICLLPQNWGPGNDVGLFWQEISSLYEVQEIIDPHGLCQPNRPEGIDACWGIGIIGAQRE